MDADEKLAKHVELIQGVINRMAGNSFVLKGWTVTLVAGLFALAASGGNWMYAALGLLPSISFWWLDAYYLRQERLFRKLHDAARRGELQGDLYSMNTAKYSESVSGLFSTAFSKSVLALHGVVVAVVVAVTIILWNHAAKGP
ncbi:MAG: hypothetical protein DYG94_01975 [Leptolyngbya sp. PLA3]|nr:MAG: hypothetical protein EDM82_02580 [Cyanobacteria bacterium CYA]MCE7967500.1 hypothetical protein [Leptolyngbya sp. PL-A3]